jgi:aspartate aminotransferase
MLKTTDRVKTVKSSSILEIAALAADMKSKGIDVVSLAAGEPDFNTPEAIQRAATKAMADGYTKYTPSNGFLKLRETIAEKVTRENGFPVSPDEVIITAGAKHALYLAMQCLLGPGDAILVPTPAWVSYGPMVELCEAEMIPLPLYEEDGYRPNVDRWKNLSIPKRARGILINSPNNPVGSTYTADDLKRLAAWAMQRGLWILSDEIYEKILFDDAKHVSVAALGPEVRENTITVSGFSKSYCMTGWRLGWAIAPKDLTKKMTAISSQSISHVTSFVQWAGIAAAQLPESEIQAMVQKFDERRKYCLERLARWGKWGSFVRPTGAFYFFLNMSPWMSAKKMSDVEFCKSMLEDYHVGLVPGSAFGKDKSFRMSYATSVEQLKKAFDRMEAFLGG